MKEIESHCGLKVEKELVDKYWEKRNKEKLPEEKVNWQEIKPIKSTI